MCAEKEFEKFWKSTGGKPGADRLYCLMGWKAHREFSEASKPSHNSAMDKIDALASELELAFDEGNETEFELSLNKLRHLHQ